MKLMTSCISSAMEYGYPVEAVAVSASFTVEQVHEIVKRTSSGDRRAEQLLRTWWVAAISLAMADSSQVVGGALAIGDKDFDWYRQPRCVGEPQVRCCEKCFALGRQQFLNQARSLFPSASNCVSAVTRTEASATTTMATSSGCVAVAANDFCYLGGRGRRRSSGFLLNGCEE